MVATTLIEESKCLARSLTWVPLMTKVMSFFVNRPEVLEAFDNDEITPEHIKQAATLSQKTSTWGSQGFILKGCE